MCDKIWLHQCLIDKFKVEKLHFIMIFLQIIVQEERRSQYEPKKTQNIPYWRTKGKPDVR